MTRLSKLWNISLYFVPLLLAGFISPGVVTAQNGPYNLTVEGLVMRGETPSIYKTVVLTTSAGETLEGQTDHTGRFRLTGTVTGDSGTLEIKSMSDIISYGSVPLTWSAGGPGEKYLTANLVTDGVKLNAVGSELPPTPTSFFDEYTETPAVDNTPVTAPNDELMTVTATPVPLQEQPKSSGVDLLMVILLILGILLGVGLLGGGIYFLKRGS